MHPFEVGRINKGAVIVLKIYNVLAFLFTNKSEKRINQISKFSYKEKNRTSTNNTNVNGVILIVHGCFVIIINVNK